MEKVKFPAVFVLSAIRYDPRTGEAQIRVFADGVTVASDEEMGKRLNALQALEYAGGLGYTMILTNVDEVDRAIGERRAELEAELRRPERPKREAGDAATSPAPKSESPRREPGNPNSTTNNGNGQGTDHNDHSELALIIRYKGMAPTPATTGGQGHLVQFELDGVPTDAPAHNVYEVRQWALENGYTVHYTGWRVTERMNGDQGQERREAECDERE